MIRSFLDSWPLFAETYLAGWSLAVLLAALGVPVVGRDQIFIGAAVTQASMLGIAAAMALGLAGPAAGGGASGWGGPWVGTAFAVVFAIAATMLTMRRGGGGQTREAITGWVFLISAALIVLLLSHLPLGMQDVQQLMLSSIIGASWTEVIVFSAMAAGAAVVILIWRRAAALWVIDRTMAAGVGLRIGWIELAFALLLGLTLGLALQTAGMLYTFGCLVLPALLGKYLCRETAMLFVAAPLVALLASVAGFVAANHLDYPPGPAVIALLCLLMGPGWLWRRLRG